MQNLTPETFWMVIGLTYLLFHGMTLIGFLDAIEADGAPYTLDQSIPLGILAFIAWFILLWLVLFAMIIRGIASLIKDLTSR